MSCCRNGLLRLSVLLCPFVLGCGGSSNMTDAERVQNSDAYRAQLTLQEAVEQLKRSGGQVEQKTYPLGEAWSVKLTGSNSINDATFDHLKTLGRVAELDLSGSNITDAQLPRLAEVTAVCFKLNLNNTQITDSGLTALADLPFLMELQLSGTKVSKAAAAKFKATRQANPNVRDFARNNAKVSL
jgi:hypothetical protein